MERKAGLHRAWLVLAGVVLLQSGMFGVLVNSNGVLFAAIRQDMGFRAGDLSVYYMVRQVASGTAVLVTVPFLFKHGLKRVNLLLGFCACGAYAAMALFGQVWQWYISGALVGVGISTTLVVTPVVLNNWFNTHKGLVIGLSSAAAGLSGALFGPVCSALVGRWGWRAAAVGLAVAAMAMIALGSLLIEEKPQPLGLAPLGRAPDPSVKVQGLPDHDLPVPGWVFAVAMVGIFCAGAYNQFNNQLPTFAQSVGYTLGAGALFTSCTMVGNIGGKLALGELADRLGIYRAAQLIMGLVLASQLLFLFGSGSFVLMCAASLLFGPVYALPTVVPPQLLLDLYGAGRYQDKLRLSQTIYAAISAAYSLAIPYLYDLTGSFAPSILYGAAVCLLGMALLSALRRFAGGRARRPQ